VRYILLLLLLVPFALAYDQTTEFNITSLPFEGQEPMHLQLEENYTLFITQYITDDKITLTYPNEYYYNNTNISNFTIDYQLADFQVFQDLSLEVAVNVNSNHPNFTGILTYGLIFNIDKSDDLVSENATDEFYLTKNGYGLNITTNLLPIERSFNFSLSGEPNALVNVTHCNEWLICPSSFAFDGNGNKKLKIGVHIPSNATVGNYERRFVLKSGNITNIGKIFINLAYPNLVFEEYIFKEKCFESEATLLKCIEEEEEFNKQRLSDIYALALAKKINFTETIYNETEVLVMTGSIDDELNKLYQSSIQERQMLTNDKQNLLTDLETCNNRILNLNTKIKVTEDNCSKTLLEEINDKEESRKKIRGRIILVIVLVTVLVIVGGYYYWYKKENFG